MNVLDADTGPRGRLPPGLGVLARGRTYRNLLYLVVAFPLGVAYFTVLVTVLSLILGLGPAGIVALVTLLPVVHGLAALEVALTEHLLGFDVPTPEAPLSERLAELDSGRALYERTKALVLARHTWTRLTYLLGKFLAGTAVFVLVTFLATLSGVLLAAPLLYDRPGTTFQVLRPVLAVAVPAVERAGVSVAGTPTLSVSGTLHEVETLRGALVASVAGAVLAVASLHVCNAVARAWGRVSVPMLRTHSAP